MSSNQQEIEAKRQRVQQMREARLRKQQQQQQQQQSHVSSVSSDASESSTSRNTPSQIDDVTALVDSLVGPQSKYKSEESSRPQSRLSDQSGASGVLQSTNNTVAIQEVFDVEPRGSTRVECYAKGVQTDELLQQDYTEDVQVEAATATTATVTTAPSSPSSKSTSSVEDEQKTASQQYQGPKIHFVQEDGNTPESLEKFLVQSGKVIGRAMEDDYDILTNYGQKAEILDDQTNETSISQTAQFTSVHSNGRAITGLDWSTKFPELLASSHTEKSNDPQASKGLVQIWNMHARSRPEYVFKAQSDVLSAKFSPFEPNLIFGTAYNGQILTWDLRVGEEAILKSPLTGSGHSHPVYTIQITGTQNANNLITSSSDGTVCTWTSDLLAKPQDRLVLTNPTVARNDEVSPTSLSSSPRHPNQFLVGTEEGSIYQCNRFDQAGSRAGLDTRGCYRGHVAPITGLDFHSSKGTIDFGDYLLSSSLDWSVKLWKIKPFSGESGSKMVDYRPVLDFKRDDMVYDVSWSPHHPAVFGSVDGTGNLEIWNLSKDTEIPQMRIKPTLYTTGKADSYLSRSLNKLSWSSVDNRIAVGGLDGIVTVFDLSEYESAQSDDYSELRRVIP